MPEPSFMEQHLADPVNRREYCRARVSVAITEAIAKHMEATGVRRVDVAKALGKSRAHITQVLNGRRNMTLNTLADVLCVCGLEVDDLVTSRLPVISLPLPRRPSGE